jgi:hypothetical protein
VPAETSRRLWSFFIALFLAVFGLNWLWEIVQMRAHAQIQHAFSLYFLPHKTMEQSGWLRPV